MPTNRNHHDEGKEMVKIDGVEAHPSPRLDSEHPGYEIQDVNVGGIVTFLAGSSSRLHHHLLPVLLGSWVRS